MQLIPSSFRTGKGIISQFEEPGFGRDFEGAGGSRGRLNDDATRLARNTEDSAHILSRLSFHGRQAISVSTGGDLGSLEGKYARWAGDDAYRQPLEVGPGEVPADLLARLSRTEFHRPSGASCPGWDFARNGHPRGAGRRQDGARRR